MSFFYASLRAGRAIVDAGMMLLLALFIGLLATVDATAADSTATAPTLNPAADFRAVPFAVDKWSYVARNATLGEVLAAFSAAQRLSIIPHETVNLQWRLSGEFRDVPPGEFLARICAMGNLIWYYDRSALYLYNASQVETVLMELMFINAGDVRRMLNDLGVEDPRYPIGTTHGDELILISGPPRYVSLIRELIAKADKLKEQRTSREDVVMVFRLKHAWADDITLGSGDKSQSVRGVASVLRELMQVDARGPVGAGTAGEAPRQSVVAEPPKNTGYAKLAPRNIPEERNSDKGDKGKGAASGSDRSKAAILADNRTNSVIVRDSKLLMPRYAELIQQLDVPVRLVEIAVTVLDIDQSAVLDWELRLKGMYTGRRSQSGAGTNSGNVLTPDSLGGLGLAMSSVFKSSNFDLLGSISALEEKSKARTISRPTILTLDNISASLTDTKSFRSRVVGKEVVELAEVTAGMRLSVQPRIIDLPQPAVPPAEGEPKPPRYEIWMMLSLEDGGFESVSVDDMPMTRSSTLETQAGVREGESLLVGGYMHEIKTETSWGIPFLRSIPWIGWLFGGFGYENSIAQRMFLLTPRVITLDVARLSEAQAVNLRTTDVERRIQGALQDADNHNVWYDAEQEKRDRESDRRWKEYLEKVQQQPESIPPAPVGEAVMLQDQPAADAALKEQAKAAEKEPEKAPADAMAQ